MNKAEAKRRACIRAARCLRFEVESMKDRMDAYELDFPEGPTARRFADAKRLMRANEELAEELERRGTRRYRDESEDNHDVQAE